MIYTPTKFIKNPTRSFSRIQMGAGNGFMQHISWTTDDSRFGISNHSKGIFTIQDTERIKNPLSESINTKEKLHLHISNFHYQSWFTIFEALTTSFLGIYDNTFDTSDIMRNEAFTFPFSIKERGEYR